MISTKNKVRGINIMDYKKIIKLRFVGFENLIESKSKIKCFLDTIGYTLDEESEPDYIMYSVFGEDYLNYDCIRIQIIGEMQTPDFNLTDYALGKDYNLCYEDRYIWMPEYVFYSEKEIQQIINRGIELRCENVFNRRFCNFVYSNAGNNYRKKLFEAINNYKNVDSGGRFLNNLDNNYIKDKLLFQSKYKFSIACENSSYKGYNTEKMTDALRSGSIPIYWGDEYINMIYNPKSFVNCNGKTLEQIINEIKELDEDIKKYNLMLNECPFSDMQQIEIDKKKMIEFFNNIFSQPILQAYRRNLTYRGKIYERKYKKMVRLYERHYFIINKIFTQAVRSKLRDIPFLRKIIWKVREKRNYNI